jgi:hypothetical protein
MAKRKRSGGGGRFFQLHHYMMDTEAWASLSAADQAIYVAVGRLYDGSNNGCLFLSVRDAAKCAHCNKDTAGKSLARLVERGFLEVATPSGFSRKDRVATEWRLTAFRCDKTGALPSRAFRAWRPEVQTTVRNQATTVPSFRAVSARKGSHGPLVSDRQAVFGR